MRVLLVVLISLWTGLVTAQLDVQQAKSLLTQLADQEGIRTADLNDAIITDNYSSRGIQHTYFKQALNGIEIESSSMAIHGKANNFHFVPGQVIHGLQNKNIDSSPVAAPLSIIAAICAQKNYEQPQNPQLLSTEQGAANQATRFQIDNISESAVTAKLVYDLVGKNNLRLAWAIEIEDVKSDDYIRFIVEANTGTIIREYNYTVFCNHDNKDHVHGDNCDAPILYPKTNQTNVASLGADSSYHVFKWPIEAPHNGPRTVEVKPWLDNTTASPFGWHKIGSIDYNVTRGNNVDAYEDSNNSNGATGGNAARAFGGSNLDFDFPLDTNGDPDLYKDAAVTNLFYWSNVIHDVWYNYGFDEPSGNFQEVNYSGNGNGSDNVRAEAQDGGGSCNANFSTPTDGGNPRMQMYLCNGRDGDFDNSVIVHEYGHGISIRLTGGPGTSSCLSGQEQMGEGWSDYFGMVMTIEPGDMGSDSRGMGTWLFGQGPDGNGIRPHPYSTDFAVNPFTYDGIKGNVTVPHGVGSVWATILWEITWALIDEHGWDADIYNGIGGNNLAMELVIEGLKLQPCAPGFVDGRDAIILADELLNNGDNHCLLWEAFARRGLGYSANQGSSTSRFDGTEAFDLPPSCLVSLEKNVDVSMALPGDTLIYSLKAKNNSSSDFIDLLLTDPMPASTHFISATDGGTLDGTTNVVSWPLINLPSGDSIEYSFTVAIDTTADGYAEDLMDDVESGDGFWTTTNAGDSHWNIENSDAASGTFSWFAEDDNSPAVANLVLTIPLGATTSTALSFNHKYDTEASWDGGVVEVSVDGGITWVDQDANFTSNGYNSTINNSRPAFSGDSGGFINSVVDLSSFAGQYIQVRFQMNCDAYVGGVGWWIDDIHLTELANHIPNIANISNSFINTDGILLTSTSIPGDSSLLHITTTAVDLSCFESMDGSASAAASSGTGNYLFNWSNGSHAASISNLAAGVYHVTVVDGTTTRIASVVVGQPESLNMAIIGTPANGAPNGAAEAVVTGGTLTYDYLWSNSATSSMIDDVAAGTYSVVVTDQNGCTTNDEVIISDLAACSDNLVQINLQMDHSASDISLFVRDNLGGVIFEKTYSAALSGRLISEYFCLVDECYIIEIVDNRSDGLCNLNSNPTGYYEVKDFLKDEIIFTGCDIGSGVTHDICLPTLSASFAFTDPSCGGVDDGSISITAAGGSGNYTYDYGTGDSGPMASGLAPGIYAVMVSDGITSVSQDITIHNSVASVFVNGDLGVGTLRYAVDNACATDTITFEANLMGNNITLMSPIAINTSKVITGLGKDNLQVNGGDATRLFDVGASGILSIRHMSLLDADSAAPGGGIHNLGVLHLEEVRLKNLKENGVGKAISGDGDVIVKGVVEVGN